MGIFTEQTLVVASILATASSVGLSAQVSDLEEAKSVLEGHNPESTIDLKLLLENVGEKPMTSMKSQNL